MIKLSVVVITYNEEANIERCIRSVEPVADEVVVVDSHSSDATAEICRRLNVRFIRHEFEGYIGQKNYAVKQAQFSHVLSVDADEALSEKLAVSIRKAKENWNGNGYMMNRLANYCGQWIRHGDWYPDRKLRLFERGKGKWGGLNPHDRFIPDSPGQTVFLAGDLLHYTYKSVEDHVAQANRFSTIGAQSGYDSGKRSNLLKIIFKPAFRFFRSYFLRLGFLDGYYGFVISRISSYETFLKYIKLRNLQREKE